ncbi:hypothetical protein PAXINDRAFT_6984 [Paxillus involutus ATCC 200175]|nr:hypothetical protein PAXINDRAFT_6984 [Paxillus involutus ATCC 200175]
MVRTSAYQHIKTSVPPLANGFESPFSPSKVTQPSINSLCSREHSVPTNKWWILVREEPDVDVGRRSCDENDDGLCEEFSEGNHGGGVQYGPGGGGVAGSGCDSEAAGREDDDGWVPAKGPPQCP